MIAYSKHGVGRYIGVTEQPIPAPKEEEPKRRKPESELVHGTQFSAWDRRCECAECSKYREKYTSEGTLRIRKRRTKEDAR